MKFQCIALDSLMRRLWHGRDLGAAWSVHIRIGRGDYSLWLARPYVHRRNES